MKKSSKKETREQKVLFGLVELYLKTGKPIGSNSLKEEEFSSEMSSATIRNYFAQLEDQGFLKQPHSSGGRIPTQEAFKLYSEMALSQPVLEFEDKQKLSTLQQQETPQLSIYLQQAIEVLSEISEAAVFMSGLRFDQDFITEIKLVSIEPARLLCVLVTEFGQILTEILQNEEKLSLHALKRIENYLQWRLQRSGEEGKEQISLHSDEQKYAKKLYNELMVRYLVRYSNFSDEEIYRTGFSRLLSYPEFSDPLALATGLSLFENLGQMRLLLNDCCRSGQMHTWIGSELAAYAVSHPSCAVLAIPYQINKIPVGAVAILGPSRIPYKKLYGTLQFFSDVISNTLTKTLYRFKISYRQPRSGTFEKSLADQNTIKLIEAKESL